MSLHAHKEINNLQICTVKDNRAFITHWISSHYREENLNIYCQQKMRIFILWKDVLTELF